MLAKYGDMVTVCGIFILCAVALGFICQQPVEYGIADQVEAVRDSVVHIEKIGYWEGSGCVISEDGIIFTARHIVEGGGRFRVTFDDGTQYETELAISDRYHDVGFLKIAAEGLQAASLTDLGELRVGDGVFIMGSPRGKLNFNSVTLGILSAEQRDLDKVSTEDWGWSILFQSDAAAHPGNSGGPVFDMDGRVVGVLVGGMADSLNYSVPVAVFKDGVDVVRRQFENDRFQIIEEEKKASYYQELVEIDEELRR